MSDIVSKIDDRKKILVAEDRESLRDLMRSICESTGHDVYAVENGAQALDFYVQCQPDLILTDFKMPQMDGIQLLEGIQQRGNGVPVVLVSGSGFNRHEIISRGFADYVAKPYKPSQITECIEKYLGDK